MLSDDRPAAEEGLLSRRLLMLLVVSAGSLTGFYLLLSVVPLYAATNGGGATAAGLSTGAMLLSTVLVEQVVPRLLNRFGYRSVMAAGLLLLGAPALALLASPAMPLVIGVGLLRGAGLGIIVVLGTALVAELVPARRRGEGLGLYGVVVGLPPIFALPVGVWLVDAVGFAPLFVAAACFPLAMLAAVLELPAYRAKLEQHSGVLGSLRAGELARPTVIFAAVTFAAGVFVTFLPLAIAGGSHDVAAAALLVQAVLTPIARWVAGRVGDRWGQGRLLMPAVLAATTGTVLISWASSPTAVVVGMGLFGVGFGLAQNVTLALMFERAQRTSFGQVSALWNLAYDAGMGLGATAVGFVAHLTGYATAFTGTALVVFAALLPAWRDQRRRTIDAR